MTGNGWIAGTQLMKEALPTFGTAREFKEWLLVRLAKGRVLARAQSFLVLESEVEGTRRIDDWSIPPEVWGAISKAADSMRKVDFSDDLDRMSGPLLLPNQRIIPYAIRRFECFGLEYARSDLLAVLGPTPRIQAETTPRGSGGKKPNKKGWSQFAAAFAVIAAQDDFDGHDDAASIYARIADFLAEQGESCFDIENVRDAITIAMSWRRGIALKYSE